VKEAIRKEEEDTPVKKRESEFNSGDFPTPWGMLNTHQPADPELFVMDNSGYNKTMTYGYGITVLHYMV
jgi:hypothetical protein